MHCHVHAHVQAILMTSNVAQKSQQSLGSGLFATRGEKKTYDGLGYRKFNNIAHCPVNQYMITVKE